MKYSTFCKFLKFIPCLGMVGCISQTDTKPNVLVILVDDAGYSSFSFNGGKDIQTRNIDQLSDEGVICTDAHVMGSVSAPSCAIDRKSVV